MLTAGQLRRVKRTVKFPLIWASSAVRGYSERGLFDSTETYCQFVGYPRSGHTLVAALLNAHPEIVIANELGVLDWVRRGLNRNQLLSLILKSDRDFARRSYQFMDYNYRVPNQWQGRFEKIRVVGDKDGARDTGALRQQPDLLGRLTDRLRLRLRVVHVLRNPFDMMATTFNRRAQRGEPISLDEAIRLGADHVASVQNVLERCPPAGVLTIRHEALVTAPQKTLAELCRFLGVEAGDVYLSDCASIVLDSPRRTRSSIPWSAAQIDWVKQDIIARFDFLAGYSFEA